MQQPSSFGRAPKPHVHRGLDSGQSFPLPEGVVGAIIQKPSIRKMVGNRRKMALYRQGKTTILHKPCT